MCDEEGLLKRRKRNESFRQLTGIGLLGNILLCPEKYLRYQIMSKLNCVYEEYIRLSSLFALDSLDSGKRTLVEELLQQAAFMKMELEILKEQIHKYGAVQVSTSGKQRQSEPAKYYTKLMSSFSSTLKTISAIMGKNSGEEDDELDKFLKGL